MGLLEALGFLVNYSKLQLEPSLIINFLGFIVDSVKGELWLPQVKLTQIRREYVSARNLAQLLGKMLAAVLAIHPAPPPQPTLP